MVLGRCRVLRERRAAFSKLDHRPGFTPPLSLLKPLHGAEPGLEEHLATFFEQDYPEYEILFCARAADDAGLETARRVAARYPQIAVRFLSTGEPPYINAKVRSMELMETEAAFDILVISDSDVRVTPDYLRSVALPFEDLRVGAITCPYRGVAAEGGLWARLEAVGMSGNDRRRAGRAHDGRHAVQLGRPWLFAAQRSADGWLSRNWGLLRRRFVLGTRHSS
jgi:ceramide glucosyltransferase